MTEDLIKKDCKSEKQNGDKLKEWIRRKNKVRYSRNINEKFKKKKKIEKFKILHRKDLSTNTFVSLFVFTVDIENE